MLQTLDGSILLWIQEYLRFEFLTPFWKFVSFLGDRGWFWIATIIILLCFTKTRKVGFAAMVALILSTLITNVFLKNMIARIRPYEVIDNLNLLIKKQGDFSFPSGHTSASFTCALIYLRMLPKKYGIPAIILASFIAFSRLYVGVHYPSDILGGILVAFISSTLVYQIFKNRYRTDEKSL